jgi:hypothetical protein
MTIHIIHLPNDPRYPHREEREKSVIHQMEMEGCEYKFWDGILEKSRKVGINKAHKQIVQWAKDNNLESVCIAEDDLRWTGTGGWKYFIENTPSDYDIYTASYYSGSHDDNFVVTGFRGCTLYIVHSRYFNTFLSLPGVSHIDGEIDRSGAKIVVSPLFVAIQASGYSEQRRRFADDSHRIKKKELFGQ